jgi:hypothetical protein
MLWLRQVFTATWPLLGFLVCIVGVLDSLHYLAAAQASQHAAGQICRGFVVLPNGFAVLSGMPNTPASGRAHTHQKDTHTGTATAEKGHSHPASPAPVSSPPQHLLGYAHGHDIVPQQGMLCVPLGREGTLAWTAVSQEPAFILRAESLNGPLTHTRRANAVLAMTVRRDDMPVEPAQVRLLARMPHHDRRMPGGHGPANDPDVQGIVAHVDSQGRYTVRPIDFTMPGPWLFEIQVHEGAITHKAYFGAYVSAE